MGLTDYLGKKRRLMIVKEVEFGVYLGNKDDKVLLPKKQVPKDVEVGDPVEVFLYKDSSDRLIATTQEPKITLDELAVLKVADTGRIGAFLDWGLEKDLLLPFKEQTAKVKKGDEVLVALYVDKSGRLCATMKVYEKLRTDSPYKKDDHVEGIIYETSDNFGVFVAVDDCYSALIPKREAFGRLRVGDQVLDVCAAPGGKSIHIAELLNGTGHVEARDLTEYKVDLLRDNIERSGLTNIEAVCQDATVYDPDKKKSADIVIADLPCSGLGVLGKKPDLRYKMNEKTEADLVELQRKILSVVKDYVKPDGKLLYSTCTIHREENEGNVEWFLKEYPEFELVKDKQMIPGKDAGDGFYIAIIKRVNHE